MPELRTYVTSEGKEWVERHAPTSSSAFIRACLALLAELEEEDPGLIQRAQEKAKENHRIPDSLQGGVAGGVASEIRPNPRTSGEHAGLTPGEVERALEEEGSVRAASERLGVTRAAIRQMRDRHNLCGGGAE